MTKKVVESASETDDETEVAPKAEVQKTVNKKEVIFPPSTFLLADKCICHCLRITTMKRTIPNSRYQKKPLQPRSKRLLRQEPRSNRVLPASSKENRHSLFFLPRSILVLCGEKTEGGKETLRL